MAVVVLFRYIVMVRDDCFIVVVMFFWFIVVIQEGFITVAFVVSLRWIVMVCFIDIHFVMFTFRCIVMKSVVIKDVVAGMVLFPSMVLFPMFTVMLARNFPVMSFVVWVAVLLPMRSSVVAFPVTMMSTSSMRFKEGKGTDGWKNGTSKERLRGKHDIQETHDEK